MFEFVGDVSSSGSCDAKDAKSSVTMLRVPSSSIFTLSTATECMWDGRNRCGNRFWIRVSKKFFGPVMPNGPPST